MEEEKRAGTSVNAMLAPRESGPTRASAAENVCDVASVSKRTISRGTKSPRAIATDRPGFDKFLWRTG